MDRTGERIRARRMDAGVSQRALAEAVGVSASYLNLIEHGKRPVGTQLVRRIAAELGLEIQLLAEPEDRALVDRVRQAAAGLGEGRIETARIDEFVTRFPGLAGLMTLQSERIADLQDRLRRLSDRITHDPDLADALHGVISAVTGIQSAAGILTEAGNLDADWQSRFQRNILEDARRLADTSRALVAYLDAPAGVERRIDGPLAARNASLARTGFHRADLEASGREGAPPAAVPDPEGGPLMVDFERTYAEDARALPLAGFVRTGQRLGWDPMRLSAELGAPLPRVLRRLASLPEADGRPVHGLVVTDASGVLLLVKSLPTFVPGQGGGCPLWPVYTALGQPGRPVVGRMTLPGQGAQHLVCHAIAEASAHPDGAHMPPLVRATMLVRADPVGSDALAIPAGLACRVCSRRSCRARREPAAMRIA